MSAPTKAVRPLGQLRREPVGPLTFAGFVDALAELYGDRPALLFERATTTYSELAEEVHEVARGLLATGVVKGARVAVLAGNRPEWIVATFAICSIGGVVVPVSTFASEEERAYILRHSDASLLVVEESLAKHRYVDELLAAHPAIGRTASGLLALPELPFLRRIVTIPTSSERPGGFETLDDLVAAGRQVPPAVLEEAVAAVTPTDDGVIIYTSGTTAHPKGVLHVQRTPILRSWQVGDHLRLDTTDVVISAFPFFWTAGFVMGMTGTLVNGSKLVLAETFDPGQVLELVERERVTRIYVAPHQDAALAEHPDAQTRDLSSLRNLLEGSHLRQFLDLDPEDSGLAQGYGSSESFTFASSIPVDAPLAVRTASHGLPFPGIEFLIVDPDTREPLPDGESGEICMRGTTLMRGYYKVPNEEVFDADGWFHTRDAGYIDDDGMLHWTGRMSGLIKTGGANVSPSELEQFLAAWGRVRTAMAVGVPHPTLGEAVVVCVTTKVAQPVTEAEVRAYLADHVSSYKIPKRVLFVDEKELSFTSSQQKVQLEALRSLAVARLVQEDLDPAWTAHLLGAS